ncbi:hypothetical protein ACFQZE_18545 [Paenibacillus sp. GCM10027627]|uniref:hypothetical protein n=1 Tax=unclassified Paenibacillus TaxID=185978 RepID=UPI00362E86F4
MIKKIIVLLSLAGILLVSCTNANPGSKMNQLPTATKNSEPKQLSETASPVPSFVPTPKPTHQGPSFTSASEKYIDESLYKEEELEIVKVLNKMMKATIEGNVEDYRNTITKNHEHQTDTGNYLSLIKVIFRSNLSFNWEKTEYSSDMEVAVDEQTFYSKANEVRSERNIYMMIEEDGEWKIGGRRP